VLHDDYEMLGVVLGYCMQALPLEVPRSLSLRRRHPAVPHVQEYAETEASETAKIPSSWPCFHVRAALHRFIVRARWKYACGGIHSPLFQGTICCIAMSTTNSVL
jgi:hypothetical protein